MRRILTQIAGTIALVSLIGGCGIKDIPKKVSDEVIGEKDAYEKALDIYKNPAEYAKGITRNVMEEREKIGIEKYFLRGKELGGIVLAPASYIERASNPYILNEKELKEENEDLKNEGLALYLIPSEYGEDIGLAMAVIQFNSKIAALKDVKESEKGYPGVSFLKDDTHIIFNLPYVTAKEEAITYIDCLIDYHKRIGVELSVERTSRRKDNYSGDNYIPTLQKIKEIINNPSDYGFDSSEEAIHNLF